MALIDIKGGASQKPVQRSAPDAFILINDYNYVVNGENNENIMFNDDIKTISISGSVDAPPAKATVSFAVTRSEENKYFFKGKCIFFPMMEIKIFLKGKYNVFQTDGSITPPPAYQQFHGVVTSVSDDYSGDTHSITLECEDLMYFLRIMKMAAHPSLLYSSTTGAPATVYKSTFEGGDVKKIIQKICNVAFGGEAGKSDEESRKNVATFVEDTLGEQSYLLAKDSNTFNPATQAEFIDTQQRVFNEYWTRRLKIRDEDGTLSLEDSNFLRLIIFGFNPPVTSKDDTDQTNTTPGASQNDLTLNADSSSPADTASIPNRDLLYKTIAPADPNVASASGGNTGINSSDASKIEDLISKASPFAQLASINVLNTEYETLLDIGITCRDYVGYEFYMSLDGNIIFKPPFFNIDVKPYRPFVVLDRDIISFSLKESDDVFTYFSVRGSPSQTFDIGKDAQKAGTAADFRLAKQFMGRYHTTDLPMAGSQQVGQAAILSMYAQNLMDIHNAKRFSGTITIPGCPEIKLGYPIYIQSRDCYGYVTNINHSFSFGNSYTTTVQVTALRYQSLSGKDMLLKPTGIEDQVLNGSFDDEEHKNIEGKGNIAGTGTSPSFIREESPASPDDTDGDFWVTRVQRLSDADGYDWVGTIGYGRDVMLDSSGNFVIKTSALSFDASLYTENITKAAKMSNIDIQSGNSNIGTTAPSSGKATIPPPNSANIDSINVKNK